MKALKFLAEELDKELAEQGIWKFAIKYVSMTERQLVTCNKLT